MQPESPQFHVAALVLRNTCGDDGRDLTLGRLTGPIIAEECFLLSDLAPLVRELYQAQNLQAQGLHISHFSRVL